MCTPPYRLLICFSACLLATLTLHPQHVRAQEEQAAILYEEGNAHFARSERLRGPRRQRALEAALDAYRRCLTIVRSRNVIYNAAVTLSLLERHVEAFNYFEEYLGHPDLEASHENEARTWQSRLGPHVAVIQIESEPNGVDVRIDRSDLPPRGSTPLRYAVGEGTHRIYLQHPGYQAYEVSIEAVIGETRTHRATLEAQPITVRIVAPGEGALTLDDQPIQAGALQSVLPGAHRARLQINGLPPVVRDFEVEVGSDAFTIELQTPAREMGQLSLQTNRDTRFFVDGVAIGQGENLQLQLPTGEHVVRAVSNQGDDTEHPVDIRAGQTLFTQLVFSDPADQSGLELARGLSTGTAIAGLLTGLGLFTATLIRQSDWDEAVNQYQRNPNDSTYTTATALHAEISALALATDVAVGLTLAAAVGSLISWLLDTAEAPAPSWEFGIGPQANEGVLAVYRMRWLQ